MAKRKKFLLKEVKESKKAGKKAPPTPEIEVIKDPRLDKIMPLIMETITRLLNASGMARFRSSFIRDIKDIMDGENEV